jgi:hypothetical protein
MKFRLLERLHPGIILLEFLEFLDLAGFHAP